MKFFFSAIFSILFSISAWSASSPSFHPSGGIEGSAGAGFAIFKITSPNNQSFGLTNSVYADLGIEKALGFSSLYIVFSIDYLTAQGQSFYNYTSPAGNYNSGGNLAFFNANFFEAGLGIRLKLLESYFIRPYIEGGGLGGYFSFQYNNLSTAVTVKPDNNFKTSDSLLEFGSYYEGGMEISFSPRFGICAAARFTNNQTKPLITLANQQVSYTTEIYYLDLLTTF